VEAQCRTKNWVHDQDHFVVVDAKVPLSECSHKLPYPVPFVLLALVPPKKVASLNVASVEKVSTLDDVMQLDPQDIWTTE
jgi:hypothetical protein